MGGTLMAPDPLGLSEPTESSSIIYNKILLVEGKDEVKFFEVFLNYLGLKGVQIIEVGGKDKFLDEFPAFLAFPGFEQVTSYAIIRDADASHTFTFESIRRLLEKYGQ